MRVHVGEGFRVMGFVSISKRIKQKTHAHSVRCARALCKPSIQSRGMISVAALQTLVEQATEKLQGHYTEKILQTILCIELHNLGVNCQTEVVLPVVRDDVFAGFNRYDVIIVEKTSTGEREVLILELKTLRDMRSVENVPARVRTQCSGYLACARAYFGAGTNIRIALVNVHFTASGDRTVRVFDMSRPPETQGPEMPPAPIRRRNGVVLYEVDKVLKSKGSGARKMVLVQWTGYAASHTTWEPFRNMPALIRRRVVRKSRR